MKISTRQSSGNAKTNASRHEGTRTTETKNSQTKPPASPATGNQTLESSNLSSESREANAPREEFGNLLNGIADWAQGSGSAEQTSEERASSLNLAEGQLLAQGRQSDPQQVTQLQEMLNSRGQGLEVDGQFGPRTAEAVRAVQRELGVTVDGIVGPETMAALNEASSAANSSEGGSSTEPLEDGGTETAPIDRDNPSREGAGLEGLPPRSENARGGQDFMSSIEHLGPGRERNQAILNEILSGNIPENSRNLQNITLNRDGREISMDVMPDYLAIGSNEDNVRIPMTPEVAQAIADRTGMSLPTDRIVDDIHGQARQLHLDPLGASPQMSSIGWYSDHDDRIDRQLGSGIAPTELVSGHKKDLVIPARDGRVAIYGGRWSDGRRVQSYSNVHQESYEDYSHGARLVSQQITIDGQTMRLADALNDPSLRSLFTAQSGNFRYD